jgi:energy-coupling factor transporter ATP-binding protein EcfA2
MPVPQTDPYVLLDDVSYRYPNAAGYALKHLSVSIRKGEFVGVLGENGAGKSTFCQAINGVVPNSRGGRMHGQVVVDGLRTQDTTVAELARRVGIVLEDPESQLFTTTVLSEVAFGPENLGVEPQEILRRAWEALEVVQLGPWEASAPSTLSGGQKQRLAIAAALAMQPDVLVLDEATSQLDPMGTQEVLSVVRALNEQHGMTIVMATNKGNEVAQFCDRVLVLHQGELIAQGRPRDVFADAELLDRVMIRTSQVSQLATFLADRGIPLSTFPVTLDEGQREVRRLIEGAE